VVVMVFAHYAQTLAAVPAWYGRCVCMHNAAESPA
jgi:hypothetical protein